VQTYIYNHFVPHKEIYKPLFRNFLTTLVSHTLVYIFSIAFHFTLDFFRIKESAEKKLLKQHFAEAQLNLLKAAGAAAFLVSIPSQLSI